MRGGVRQSVVGGGHRHGPPLGVPGRGEGVRRELGEEKESDDGRMRLASSVSSLHQAKSGKIMGMRGK